MTAHELARRLLEGPDAPVVITEPHPFDNRHEVWSEAASRQIEQTADARGYLLREPITLITLMPDYDSQRYWAKR